MEPGAWSAGRRPGLGAGAGALLGGKVRFKHAGIHPDRWGGTSIPDLGLHVHCVFPKKQPSPLPLFLDLGFFPPQPEVELNGVCWEDFAFEKIKMI